MNKPYHLSILKKAPEYEGYYDDLDFTPEHIEILGIKFSTEEKAMEVINNLEFEEEEELVFGLLYVSGDNLSPIQTDHKNDIHNIN